MKTIELTKGKSCIVDDEDYDLLIQHHWCFSGHYAARGIKIKGRNKRVFMHRCVIQVPVGYEVDHINGDKLDNRKENLRICTRTQNLHNRGVSVKNTSGYKGVSWDNRKNKWRAAMRMNNHNVFIGYFDNKEDAAIAYDSRAKVYQGEYARLNIQNITNCGRSLKG